MDIFKNLADSFVKEVVDPTVSFAEDSAKTVVREVVDPTVAFVEDSARTVVREVIDPAVAVIETQFQRPRDVIEQEKILDNLLASNGSRFPGDDYHSPDRKNWMAHLSVEKLTLNKIVWPGTHDSATNGIGIDVVTRPLGECQTLSIYEQLVRGTRLLDVRVQEDRHICHGILASYNVDFVIDDVIRFLSETHSEIIILEIRTEYGHKDPPEFESYLTNKLGQFLIHQDDNLFNKSLSEILPKRILKEGHMKVQTVVAWAVSELASNHPKCQDHFAQNNIIRFLVSHLAFETVQEHSKYAIVSNKQSLSSIHTVVMASNTNPSDKSHDQDETNSNISHPMGNQTPSQMHSLVANTFAIKGSGSGSGSGSGTNKNQTKQSNQQHQHHTKGGPTPRGNNPTHVSLMGTSIKGREYEDPETKAQMKAMAARALWQLSRGNLQICRSITESRALLCFAVLLEKGDDEVKSYSALAMMEITDVAEQYSELRRSAFKPTSPAAKAVVEQLLKVIENEVPDLLIPCVKSIGSLSRTFRATETRIIAPLVKLLDEREAEVAMEAAVALIKFACTENFLRDNHSKAIIAAGGAKHLIQLVYFGEQMVQAPALVLLCYIALNVPDSETLAQEEVLVVLEWSTKQSHLVEAPTIDEILPEAKSRLELYQSRGSRGFH
ncbi:hypothetical protein DY000_02009922 [Brassica cretica]|uniref:Phosphatidylinositol-specific phospholipase C X domain-containing protein n=1 Tax=Brassica cretica TaxID=69181 RepID=A0ABQ7BWA8_BRACR|nr:hypothetical protein DY000_02009922 [Brassica cretica]